MPNTTLSNLRRKQRSLKAKLCRHHATVARLTAELADTEAAIKFLHPLAAITPPKRRGILPFERGELPRLALAIMRGAGRPVPVRVIAAKALALKGVTLPEPHVTLATRRWLQVRFAEWQKRGVTIKFGTRNERKRALAKWAALCPRGLPNTSAPVWRRE